MELDDDFGYLYSDILLPPPSNPSKPPSPPPNPQSTPGKDPATSHPIAAATSFAAVSTVHNEWLLSGDAPPAVDPTSNWADEWDNSDSEDDLKIVLNDTDHGVMKDLGSDDEDEGDLVIVINDNQFGTTDQDWGEEDAGFGGKGDGGKVAGIGGTGGAGPSRSGYSNNMFDQHSLYKYARPSAPVPGGPAGGVAGPQAQLRSPLPGGPYPGKGRGDWTPVDGKTMNGPGYGMSAWGNKRRPFGVGSGFSLPPKKTIFDFETDNFEEKPWRHPGSNLTDFFNFGLNEEAWKDYCKRCRLKIESTMQSKIPVYESRRSDLKYDPDAPPELASAILNAKEDGQLDFGSHVVGPTSTRPPLHTGGAIQVEGGYAERLPSIFTRPPRLRESDSIIEIVLQDFIGNFTGAENNSHVTEQTERDSHEVIANGDSIHLTGELPHLQGSHRIISGPVRCKEKNNAHYKTTRRGRDRYLVPPPHAFRGRSFKRFRGYAIPCGRLVREDVRIDPWAGKRITRNFEREKNTRVRKRMEEAEWRGARKMDCEEGVEADMKRRKEEKNSRRGKVERWNDDHHGLENKKSEVKGTTNEQQSSKKVMKHSKSPPRPLGDHNSNLPDNPEDPTSDDDGTHDDFRRGRSKLERWTREKDRDYTAICTFLRAHVATVPSEPNLNISDSNPIKATKDEAIGQAPSDNRHLDTVERLDRRSECFKLPMPGEEVAPNRQADNELASGETEVMLEPLPCKRWTGN